MYKIYKITNQRRPYEIYVGSTKQVLEKRFQSHIARNDSACYQYIQRDGRENFEIIAIDYANTKKEALEKEEFWTLFLSDQGYFLYNKNAGSKLSDEAKKKISEVKKGKHMSEEARKKMSEAKKGKNNPLYGKHLSEDTKKLISEKAKERLKDPTKNPFYGKNHSDDTKKLISKKAKDGPVKQVRCIENNKIYESCIAAAKDLNCSISGISKAANGKLKSTHGLHFEYV